MAPETESLRAAPRTRKKRNTRTQLHLTHRTTPSTQEFQVLCSHAACTRKTAQHETPTCARCAAVSSFKCEASQQVGFLPPPSCARPDVTSASTSPTSTLFSLRYGEAALLIISDYIGGRVYHRAVMEAEIALTTSLSLVYTASRFYTLSDSLNNRL